MSDKEGGWAAAGFNGTELSEIERAEDCKQCNNEQPPQLMGSPVMLENGGGRLMELR